MLFGLSVATPADVRLFCLPTDSSDDWRDTGALPSEVRSPDDFRDSRGFPSESTEDLRDRAASCAVFCDLNDLEADSIDDLRESGFSKSALVTEFEVASFLKVEVLLAADTTEALSEESFWCRVLAYAARGSADFLDSLSEV